MTITQETIDSIKTVFRDAANGALWGIPYKMNHDIGQTPKHVWDGHRSPHPTKRPPVYVGFTIETPGPQLDWTWLGTPGWFGSMTEDERELAEEFVAKLKAEDMMPSWPGEWVEV